MFCVLHVFPRLRRRVHLGGGRKRGGGLSCVCLLDISVWAFDTCASDFSFARDVLFLPLVVGFAAAVSDWCMPDEAVCGDECVTVLGGKRFV